MTVLILTCLNHNMVTLVQILVNVILAVVLLTVLVSLEL